MTLFSAQKTENRPVVVDRDREMALLGAADVVLAIQREEADVVAAHHGADRVIVVPMAVKQVDSAQPGGWTNRDVRSAATRSPMQMRSNGF